MRDLPLVNAVVHALPIITPLARYALGYREDPIPRIIHVFTVVGITHILNQDVRWNPRNSFTRFIAECGMRFPYQAEKVAYMINLVAMPLLCHIILRDAFGLGLTWKFTLLSYLYIVPGALLAMGPMAIRHYGNLQGVNTGRAPQDIL